MPAVFRLVFRKGYNMFLEVSLKLLEGFGVTFKIFALTLAFSLPLGLIISFGSMSRFAPVKWLTKGFVWIIRGTPLMLQLIVIFYGPGLLFDLHFLEQSGEFLGLKIKILCQLGHFSLSHLDHRFPLCRKLPF